VSAAKQQMKQLDPGADAGCDSKIFAAVREDLRRKLAHLEEKLDDMWAKVVVWSYGTTGGLQVMTQVEAPDGRSDFSFQEIVGGAAALETLDSLVQQFCARAMQVVFDQVCADKTLGVEAAGNAKLSKLNVVPKGPIGGGGDGGAGKKAVGKSRKKGSGDATICKELYVDPKPNTTYRQSPFVSFVKCPLIFGVTIVRYWCVHCSFWTMFVALSISPSHVPFGTGRFAHSLALGRCNIGPSGTSK
jgi:hypothetical protein